MLPESGALWAVALLAAALVGFSKTGIPGVGILAVALFANVFDTRQSVGLVLPLLILGDAVAVVLYRRHARFGLLARLLPWALGGLVLGHAALGHLDTGQTQALIGALLVLMVALHLLRRWWLRRNPAAEDRLPQTLLFAATMGILAGFTTMVANAAGPVMVLFLLAAGLPKLEFVGTGAWFFALVNLVKVPFLVNLGLIGWDSLEVNAWLAPAVLVGATAGRWLLPRVSQSWFENLALVLSLAAGLRLLLS